MRQWAQGTGHRAKTDRQDALLLARFGAAQEPAPHRPLALEVSELDSLLQRRQDLEQMIQQEKNRLDAMCGRPGIAAPVITNLEQVLQALERSRRRRVVVVDEQQRVLGIITDGDLLRRSRAELRPGLLNRLRRALVGQPTDKPVALPDGTETAVTLMTHPVTTISPTAAPADALRLMVQQGVKRLPVVDENGRLVGLLGRASLLRGLLE